MNELAPATQDGAPSHFARISGGMRAFLRHALDVALPPLCPACRAPLGDGDGLREMAFGVPFALTPCR